MATNSKLLIESMEETCCLHQNLHTMHQILKIENTNNKLWDRNMFDLIIENEYGLG